MMLEYTGAVFLIIFSYTLPLFFLSIRRDKTRLAAFYLVITAQHLVSLFNYFIFTIPGAELDASTFSSNAQGAVLNGVPPTISVGTNFYEYILYLSYSVFGANKLVGQSLCILAAVASCIFILRIAERLKVRGVFLTVLLIAIGLTPSFLLYTSLTFREAFQLLGFVGGIFFAYEAFLKRSPVRLLISSAFYIFLGLFHQILLALSLTLILITWVFYFLNSGVEVKVVIRNILVSSLAIIILGYITIVNIPIGKGHDYLKTLVENGGVVKMLGSYRAKIDSEEPRSSFGVNVDTTSLSSTGYGLALSYIHYLYGPGLHEINKVIDVVPAINSLGRLLVSLLLLYLLIRKVDLPEGMMYLIIVYLSVTSMWSIGTTNYGQAFRHNSLTDWMLAMILVIGLQQILNSKTRAMTET